MATWILGLVLVLLAAPVPGQMCPGDNNNDGVTTVDEIVASVNTALNGCSQPTGLAALVGGWLFQTTIGSQTFFDHYLLERIEIVNGSPLLMGTDLDDNGAVVAEYDPEFADPFILLDPGILICNYFEFDLSHPSRIVGTAFQTDKNTDGSCGEIFSNSGAEFIGYRVVSGDELSSSRAAGELTVLDEQLRLREIVGSVGHGRAAVGGSTAPRLSRLRELAKRW